MTLRTREAIELLRDMLEPIPIKLPDGTIEPYFAAYVGPVARKRLQRVLDLLLPPKPRKETPNENPSDPPPTDISGTD